MGGTREGTGINETNEMCAASRKWCRVDGVGRYRRGNDLDRASVHPCRLLVRWERESERDGEGEWVVMASSPSPSPWGEEGKSEA